MIWEGRALAAADAAALKADPESIWDLVEEEGDPPDVVELDKAWHRIHWLLTGSASGGEGPLAQAILGGEEFGEDVGYGPPRLLDASGVSAVAAALAPISVDQLRARYDADAIAAAEVYPDIVDDGDVFDSYLAPNFEQLKALYSHAAAEGLWVLQSIM